jgi:predicted PilT family ATPase
MLVRWHHRNVAICHGINNDFVCAECRVRNSEICRIKHFMRKQGISRHMVDNCNW